MTPEQWADELIGNHAFLDAAALEMAIIDIRKEALEEAAALCRQFADERKNSGHDTTLHELEDAIRALGGDNE